ncbi:MAG TPA: polysaccharide biosynthesis/export family protein [Pyrinomonadaceae bacterium]|nr:polysaccharide biosynthesis/export family protein [Pyrinomonadaceae bacterium]
MKKLRLITTLASFVLICSVPAFAQNTDIYRVGAGDVLDIRLHNAPGNSSTLFTVVPSGVVELPIAGGAIKVTGLTPDEIQTRIAAELKRRAIDDKGKVFVGVRQYASHPVTVTGLVVQPGIRFLRREEVPLYVVLAESQLRNDGGRAVILRAGTPAQTLDLRDPAALNVHVQAGDVINVTSRPEEFYFVGGRINLPGQKPFTTGITLLQAILAAGGTPRKADVVEISREGAEGRLVTMRYRLKDIKSGNAEDPKLQPGDRVEVGR